MSPPHYPTLLIGTPTEQWKLWFSQDQHFELSSPRPRWRLLQDQNFKRKWDFEMS